MLVTAAHRVPSVSQLTDASSEASGLYTATFVVAADAGLSTTPDIPRPRFSPATPAKVRRAPSPALATATSEGAPSIATGTPGRSPIRNADCAEDFQLVTELNGTWFPLTSMHRLGFGRRVERASDALSSRDSPIRRRRESRA